MSSNVAGIGIPYYGDGCVQGCIMPFISKYKQSISPWKTASSSNSYKV